MNDTHSSLGAYVADAVDEAERAVFEKHLLDCAECRREVASMRETLAALGEDHGVAPPPDLKADILHAISTTPMLPVEDPRPPEQVIPGEHSFGRRRRPVATWLAAAAAVVAIALGGVVAWQQVQIQSIQVAEAQRSDLLAAPDLRVRHTTLDGGALTYLVSPDRGQALVTSSALPAPGDERSWQVWVLQDGVPRSGALIDRGGEMQIWISDVSGGEALAITNEPRGGSTSPTGEVQALVELT